MQIRKGIAEFRGEGLRCMKPVPIKKFEGRMFPCNHQICRKNRFGYIAGDFKCAKCEQIIEVT